MIASDAVATGVAARDRRAVNPTVFRFAIFVLAIFVGYYVVWSVTPALHYAADVGDQTRSPR